MTSNQNLERKFANKDHVFNELWLIQSLIMVFLRYYLYRDTHLNTSTLY